MGGKDRDALGVRLAGMNQALEQVDGGLGQVESDMKYRFDEASDERRAIHEEINETCEEMNKEFDRTEWLFRRGLLAFFLSFTLLFLLTELFVV